jgi:hypothetical protein
MLVGGQPVGHLVAALHEPVHARVGGRVPSAQLVHAAGGEQRVQDARPSDGGGGGRVLGFAPRWRAAWLTGSPQCAMYQPRTSSCCSRVFSRHPIQCWARSNWSC